MTAAVKAIMTLMLLSNIHKYVASLPIVFLNEGETHFFNKIDGDENNSISHFT